MNYLELCGFAFNILLIAAGAYLTWVLLLWPMIEALSMCRWYAAIGREYPTVKPKKGWINVWWSCVEIGGRNFEATSNKYGRWGGVGQWDINLGETQNTVDSEED